LILPFSVIINLIIVFHFNKEGFKKSLLGNTQRRIQKRNKE